MKPRLVYLLCAAALLPAALLAQNVDIGVSWDPVPSDTVPPDTTVELGVRLTNYTHSFTEVNLFYIMMDTNMNVVYDQWITVLLEENDSTLTLPAFNVSEPFYMECSLFVSNDTNPANDTVWWRPVFLRYACEEPRATAGREPEFRASPSLFSRAVTIHCREPAPVLVFDAGGSLVRTIAPARRAIWDGRDRYGRDAPAGVYNLFCGPGRSQRARVVKTE
jgi:hypothetical protein